MIRPPADIEELVARAEGLRDCSVAELADALSVQVPTDSRRAKGWVGQLVEAALGATARSRAEPDFGGLGVELKTIPVDAAGTPRESTYVCTVADEPSAWISWDASWARRKLSKVLFVPIRPGEGIGDRRFGQIRLWSPSDEEDAALRADWEALREVLSSGERWAVSGRTGRFLQVRPKAADRDDSRWTQDGGGDWVRALPLGFYLRASFTKRILA